MTAASVSLGLDTNTLFYRGENGHSRYSHKVPSGGSTPPITTSAVGKFGCSRWPHKPEAVGSNPTRATT